MCYFSVPLAWCYQNIAKVNLKTVKKSVLDVNHTLKYVLNVVSRCHRPEQHAFCQT